MSREIYNNKTQPPDTLKRQFLRHLSTLASGAIISNLLSNQAICAAMTYVPALDSAERTGKILQHFELQTLRQICAVIIPKTDTPGAAEVDTHGFIDNQLYYCYNNREQQRVQQLLQWIEKSSHKRYQNAFTLVAFSQQTQLLTDIDLGEKEFTQLMRKEFKLLKSLIVFGYYTSEVGASMELRYQAIPGGFTGSIAYRDIGRAWGSFAFY